MWASVAFNPKDSCECCEWFGLECTVEWQDQDNNWHHRLGHLCLLHGRDLVEEAGAIITFHDPAHQRTFVGPLPKNVYPY